MRLIYLSVIDTSEAHDVSQSDKLPFKIFFGENFLFIST